LPGFRVQGRTKETAVRVYYHEKRKVIEAAGTFSIVLEVSYKLATFYIVKLSILHLIGIQERVAMTSFKELDMLVSSLSKGPKFLKKYETWENKRRRVIAEYKQT
jgi:ketopantoate hydroxymethyltransferase